MGRTFLPKIGVDTINSKNLRNQLGNCFRLIRFGAMEDKHIGQILAKQIYKKMFDVDEITDLFRMKMDTTFRSIIFDNTKRAAPMKTELTCQSGFLTGHCYLKSQESVWFSTNGLVQLKSICYGSISSPSGRFKSDVEIIEYHTNTFKTNATSKTLATKTNCSIGNGYNTYLTPHITINPSMMYEIRVIDVPTGCYYNNADSAKSSEIKLNNKITIRFHHDPSDNDSVRRNLVSKLTFITS